tara:strand:- start:1520 stop:2803 length:1284 start_codon:yes stop_codon:yes gene_type:complete
MARVITGPGAIFRQVSEFQAPKIRQTGMDRTKEAWASPKGIETGVGLVDLIGGSIHSGVDLYQAKSKRGAAIRGSERYRGAEKQLRTMEAAAQMEDDPNRKQEVIRRERAEADVRMAATRARMAEMERTGQYTIPKSGKIPASTAYLPGVRADYEQSLAQAAAAKHPGERQRAALAALGAADRPRAARWSDRLAGKPEDEITKQVKRLYPEEYRKPRPRSGGAAPRALKPHAMKRILDTYSGESGASRTIRSANALNQASPWDGTTNPAPQFFDVVTNPVGGKSVLAIKMNVAEASKFSRMDANGKKIFKQTRIEGARLAMRMAKEHPKAVEKAMANINQMVTLATEGHQLTAHGHVNNPRYREVDGSITALKMSNFGNVSAFEALAIAAHDPSVRSRKAVKSKDEKPVGGNKKKPNPTGNAGSNAP